MYEGPNPNRTSGTACSATNIVTRRGRAGECTLGRCKGAVRGRFRVRVKVRVRFRVRVRVMGRVRVYG